MCIRPWLRPDPEQYLFCPREAMAEFRAAQRRARTSTRYPSQRARARKPDPKYTPGDRYTTKTYHHAIGYGCRRAGIPPWHPNQLRHTAATWIRRLYDLEGAQVVLGHAKAEVTQVYADRDLARARDIMAEIG